VSQDRHQTWIMSRTWMGPAVGAVCRTWLLRGASKGVIPIAAHSLFMVTMAALGHFFRFLGVYLTLGECRSGQRGSHIFHDKV
jgi:hypothetical protein